MTFTDLTLPAGLNLPSQGARQVAFGDFDGEGAPDLFLVRSDAACQLFLNQRQDLFRNRTVDWGIRLDRGARAAAVADFDRDGDWDLAAAGARPHGSVLYRNEGGKFVPDEAILQPLGGAETEWVQFLDYDNDTWLDLVFAGPSGIRRLGEGVRLRPGRGRGPPGADRGGQAPPSQ